MVYRVEVNLAGDSVVWSGAMVFRARQEGWYVLLIFCGRRSREVDSWHVLVSAHGIKHHEDSHSQTQALWESTIPSVPALSPDIESSLMLTGCQRAILDVNGGSTPFCKDWLQCHRAPHLSELPSCCTYTVCQPSAKLAILPLPPTCFWFLNELHLDA